MWQNKILFQIAQSIPSGNSNSNNRFLTPFFIIMCIDLLHNHFAVMSHVTTKPTLGNTLYNNTIWVVLFSCLLRMLEWNCFLIWMVLFCFCKRKYYQSCVPTWNDTSYRNIVLQGEVSDENAYALGGISGRIQAAHEQCDNCVLYVVRSRWTF